jgi:hypothetical protein
MILFETDWYKYPTAIIDTQTTNKSWVRLAAVYRSMGIKNHAFLLALVNPKLQGVDPFSKHLTADQMYMIAAECKVNPWYFFREIARAPGNSGSDAVPLEANRANIALYWSFFNHVFFTLIQPRQTGKSFSTDTLMSYLMNVVCTGTSINLLTKDDNLRRKNIERIKEIMSELPPYLSQRSKDDAQNGEEITIKALKNSYNTHVPQSSPKRAYNMGRGLTTAIFHIDEPPFQPNIAIALPAALAATGAAVERAKAAGAPYGTILTTTAGKKDDKDGRFIYKLLEDSATWTEKFFDCKDWAELDRMVRRNSRAGLFRINGTFSHRQLGKSDEWLKQKIEESLQTGDDANRDYFNLWTSGTESSPLSTAIAEMIASSRLDELYTSISDPDGYITRWYIPEDEIEYRMANGKFVLGMDTSEAGGGDDISLVLMDVETLDVVAAGSYNETNLITFSKWVCDTLVKYPNITAVIERRSTGAMLLDYLLLMLPNYGEDPFKRIFNKVVQDYDEYPDRYKEIKVPMGRRPTDIFVRYKTTFGFATSGSGANSRTALYGSTLQAAAQRAGMKVHDKMLAGQILGLVYKNGRIDHEDGEHDDLVIGWLLCHWFLMHGKNLSHYGIDPRQVMCAVKTPQQESSEDFFRRMEQQTIRSRIEEIYNNLTGEHDDFVAARLEQELRMLDKKIILEQDEIYSVDELIRSARETKKNKVRHMNLYQQQQQNQFIGHNTGMLVTSDVPTTHVDMFGAPQGYGVYGTAAGRPWR